MPDNRTNHQRNRNRTTHGRGADRLNQGGQLPPCEASQADMKAALTVISAPYNFVPLADWVHCPDWGTLVNHDLPLEKGVSGEIPYTLVAETPILVGGEQRPGTEHVPGEVDFARTPAGYAIPGSALRGMLRSVVEIAAFGRMRQVDDVRHGLRDISGPAAAAYTGKVRNQVKTGFLRRSGEGLEVVPCNMVRLDHRDIESWLGVGKPVFRARTNVGQKYAVWQNAVGQRCAPMSLPFDPDSGEATNLGRGREVGFPVFTGQISDSTKPRGKRRDFVFYAPRPREALAIRDEDWRAFLLIHGDEENNADMSWPGYWRNRFGRGEEIPVFYLDDGTTRDGRRKIRLGLAYMPKLAWDFSVHDLINHTDECHLEGPDQGGKYDMADLLFGALGDEPARHLKGRVSCGLAMAAGDPQPEATETTILNGPKPTYFPNYLRQKTDSSSGRLTVREYATCVKTQGNTRPRLRGFKRYPARPDARVQPLTEEQRGGRKKVQVKLHPLPAGTRFNGSIQFHNLRPEELGALIWAMTWGRMDGLRHGLGMGKPFGFGQVRFEVAWAQTWQRANRDLTKVVPLDPQVLCGAFATHMEGVWPKTSSWATSEQIANLTAMADPARAEHFPAKLQHMRIERCGDPDTGQRVNHNEFAWAKQARPKPLVLLDYAIATGGNNGPGAGGSSQSTASPKHPWLIEALPEIAKANNIPDLQVVWGGRPLAAAWHDIEDPETKAAVLEEITAYWKKQDWWKNPPKGAKRKAKNIYGSE